ncbi:28S ribosomal protein S31, mitochondrial [Ischnura elegans]|uniref:28S ribosomal protein S31, mitochondrial n=1 Tax=Ischnura elegans TaxID=197161 RepID=UPI001ED87FF7|nr:28S ribosomal protein S31, mitochondrial [Ischnura elegans]
MFGVLLKGQLQSNTWEKSSALAIALRKFNIACRSCGKDDQNSGSDIKKPEVSEKPKADKKVDGKEKLNDLLKLMMKDGPSVTPKEGLQLAKPKKITKPKPAKIVKDGIVSSEELDRKIAEATKDVAASLGGDVKETEAELLQKLLSSKSPENLSDVIGGMKIDRGDETTSQQRRTKDWSQVRREDAQTRRPMRLAGKKERSKGEQPRIDLFGGPRLGIFEKIVAKDVSTLAALEVWDRQEAREIKLSTSHPPRNYFQQMILWTEQGKLWKFPIHNEQGLDEEKKVFFTEHVFLERHLDPWCPKKGPLRHFMELVCVGLSKNPYMTVGQKKDTIKWYADYFEAKKDVLKEVGALMQ